MVERSQRLEGGVTGKRSCPKKATWFRCQEKILRSGSPRVHHRIVRRGSGTGPTAHGLAGVARYSRGLQPGLGACSSEAPAQPPAIWGGTEAAPPLSCVAGSTFVPRCAFKFYVDPSLPLASARWCGPLWLPRGVQPDIGGRQVSPGDLEVPWERWEVSPIYFLPRHKPPRNWAA